jgi:hypothetical protein
MAMIPIGGRISEIAYRKMSWQESIKELASSWLLHGN